MRVCVLLLLLFVFVLLFAFFLFGFVLMDLRSLSKLILFLDQVQCLWQHSSYDE